MFYISLYMWFTRSSLDLQYFKYIHVPKKEFLKINKPEEEGNADKKIELCGHTRKQYSSAACMFAYVSSWNRL